MDDHKKLLLVITSLILYSANLFADEEIPIGYSSAFEALEYLKKDPSAKINRQDGWSIVSLVEDGSHVVWFFAPEKNGVYPAVFKKTILGEQTKILTLCEAPKAECDSLRKQFKNINNKDH